MFADYRVPQGLVHLGVLCYSDDLMQLLRKNSHLESGSRLEAEIRGASIWAVELIRKEMEIIAKGDKASGPLNAIVIDYYLWNFAKEHQQEMRHVPIHKTRSVYY